MAQQIAHTLALVTRQMAKHEAWVQTSAMPHAGKTIAVSMTVLGRALQLSWQVDESLILKPITLTTDASVTLTVAPSVYAALAQLPFEMARIMRHVRIAGDADLAEWVNRLAQHLRPDVWEDVSRLIGDTPAQMLSQGVNHMFVQLKKTAQSLTAHAQHALLDETPIGIRHATLNDFAQDAQQLRYALERLEQRVAKLS